MSMHGAWTDTHQEDIPRRPALPAWLQINSDWLLSEETVGSPSRRKSAVRVPVLVAHSRRRKIAIGNGDGVADGAAGCGEKHVHAWFAPAR
jgi:hypothetical protein